MFGDRVVDALAGVFHVEDLVAERAQAQQVHQRAPGHAAERIARDDAGDENLHGGPASQRVHDLVDRRRLVERAAERQPRAHAAVEVVAGQQLVVRALGDQAALVQHEDAVGVADGRQPVGDDDRGAAGAEAAAAR